MICERFIAQDRKLNARSFNDLDESRALFILEPNPAIENYLSMPVGNLTLDRLGIAALL
jgi:hypothetical protein